MEIDKRHPLYREFKKFTERFALDEMLEHEEEWCWEAFLAGTKAEASARGMNDLENEIEMMKGI